MYTDLEGKRFCFEGIPGSGKTTLIKHLVDFIERKSAAKVLAYPEPINQELLDLYVSDMPKYSFSFQMYMMGRRIAIIESASKNRGISLIDRGADGDRIFAQVQISKGWMSKEESNVYESTYRSARIPNMHTVYISCSPETALNRLKKRGNADVKYTIAYMEELSSVHDAKFSNNIVIDWNDDLDEITDEHCRTVLETLRGSI